MKNNGPVKRTCQIQKGIKQGCSISKLFYFLIVEIVYEKKNHKQNEFLWTFLKPNTTMSKINM